MWTAHFEAFDETPPGTYRFEVSGQHRHEREPVPYALASAPFEVEVWQEIEVHSLSVDAEAGTASVHIDGVELTEALSQLESDDDGVLADDEIHYPETYDSTLSYIDRHYDQESDGPDETTYRYCYRCTFRPWANTGTISKAAVTVRHPGGSADEYALAFDGSKWSASGLVLLPGDEVQVDARAVIDEFDNVNGSPSERVIIGSGSFSPPGPPEVPAASEPERRGVDSVGIVFIGLLVVATVPATAWLIVKKGVG